MSKSNTKFDAVQAKGLRMALPDAYDVDELDFDQIVQQIEQTAPYTDFIVFKGLMSSIYIEILESKMFYVNTLEDQTSKQDYTVVSW